MSERKVLTKYYPPDFDPRQLQRVRGSKSASSKLQTVRLMAPFSMRCERCGEYIYRGRKFNARKEIPPDKYLGIQIFRFYIKCTRCSGEITFTTDPANADYKCERGAKRNVEPWYVGKEETEEQRLDRLEREQAEEEGRADEERNAMVELEAKTEDAKREMAVADALDEIRTRNARLERADRDGVEAGVADSMDDEAARLEAEDAELARRAFEFARQVEMMTTDVIDEEDSVDEDLADGINSPPTSISSTVSSSGTNMSRNDAPGMPTPMLAASVASKDMPPPSFKRLVKKKKDHASALGIKKKPALV